MQKNFYDYTAYRPLLRDQAAHWKATRPGWTLQKIAAKAQVQAPYLTNVLKERVHLSADQLHSLGQVFGWSGEEAEFAALLLEWERSGNANRREALKEKAEAIRQSKKKAAERLDLKEVKTESEDFTRFYLNPFYLLINAFMGIPRFARDADRIGRCLHLQPRMLRGWVKDLVEMRFLAAGPKGYTKQQRNFFLNDKSPVYAPHANLLQQLISQHLIRLPREERYNFTVNISADPATRQKILEEFKLFLKKIEPMVKAAPPEELYGLRFDLFPWSFEDEGAGG